MIDGREILSTELVFDLCTVSKELFGACIIQEQQYKAQTKTRLNLMINSSLVNGGFLRKR